MIKKYNKYLCADIDKKEGVIKIYMNKYEPLFKVDSYLIESTNILLDILLDCPKEWTVYYNGRPRLSLFRRSVKLLDSVESDSKMFDWMLVFKFDERYIKKYRRFNHDDLNIENVVKTLCNNIHVFNKKIKDMYKRINIYALSEELGKFKILNFFNLSDNRGTIISITNSSTGGKITRLGIFNNIDTYNHYKEYGFIDKSFIGTLEYPVSIIKEEIKVGD